MKKFCMDWASIANFTELIVYKASHNKKFKDVIMII